MKNISSFLLFVLSLTTCLVGSAQKKFSLSDQWRTWTFYPRSVYGVSSMNDGKHYTTINREGNIEQFSYADGNRTGVVFKAATYGIKPSDYAFSKDESKLLLVTEKESIYRHSFLAEYYIYDIRLQSLQKLSDEGKQQVAGFSPAADKVAFVRDNNLFIKDLKSGEERQITQDGEYNKIINGIPDWVYEEEFGFNKAYTWLPDGKHLAYIKFDETHVPTYGMQMYAGKNPELSENELYPEYRTFKYPKAGEDNSIVSVHVYDLESQKTITADIGKDTDIYIPGIRAMHANDKFAIFKLNRLQNKFEMLYANVKTGKCKTAYTEENKYYFDADDLKNIQFTKDGKYFFMTSERTGYRHLFLHDISGKSLQQLTSGKNEIITFYGYNPDTKLAYFSAFDNSPINTAIYSVHLKNKKTRKLSRKKGTNQAEFSKNFTYYIDFFSDASTPPFVTLHTSKGKKIRILEDNKSLNKKIKDYGGTRKEFFNFTTDEGVNLNAWMIKPPHFDKNRKYPVIITQYSGPGSQEVENKWDFNFVWNYLLAQEGAIVMCVDPRGTGGRGEKFKKMTYLQLGKYETEDLIATARWLQKQPYVNPQKIGIWGWSFGGFTTAICMTKGADYFAAGISVAPVTNWRYYDNIYTERFMRTPQENPGGYDNNSPTNFASKLKGKYLLIHGSADDNVHLQNTMEFSEALVQADKTFEQFIYTNRNHGIFGGNTRYHLYRKMLNFWKEHLLSKE